MLTDEQLLEGITEAMRCQRRFGPNYPTIFDSSCIVWNTSECRVELDLIDNGKQRKFDLLLREVDIHGD